MITVRKLGGLKERTRKRKVSMILHEAAVALRAGKDVDFRYIDDVISLAGLEAVSPEPGDPGLAFRYEDMSQSILSELGAEPSDWDFTDDAGNLDAGCRILQDKVLVLDRIRSPYNVGAIFRSADSFGIREIVLIDGTASPEHTRAQRTSRGTTGTVKWRFMSENDAVAFLFSYDKANVMALELGGTSINDFRFPERGAAVLGSEEFGVSPAILGCCGSRISIPMGGSKGSLNVSVAAGILMQRWF